MKLNSLFMISVFLVSQLVFSQTIDMVYIEGGTFIMGSNDGGEDEKPLHEVTLNSFYIGKCEITQKEWKEIMGSNPSFYEGEYLPVENVSWTDVQEFIKKINKYTRLEYRLPTEAEWEYAAKGGNKSQGFIYAGSNNLNEIAWYKDNSDSTTHPVGTKMPNELGIYDMTGNVWEWCQDSYGAEYYKDSPSDNPLGPKSGSERVIRGGSWDNDESGCRIANRSRYYLYDGDSYYGFRLVLDVD